MSNNSQLGGFLFQLHSLDVLAWEEGTLERFMQSCRDGCFGSWHETDSAADREIQGKGWMSFRKGYLDGRQSSGNQNPADSGMSPVPYKWNYIPMLAESSVPYVLYALGPLPSAPVHPFPNLVSARCFCPHLNAQNIAEQYKMMAPSLPRLKLVWALMAQGQGAARPYAFQWLWSVNLDFWRKY